MVGAGSPSGKSSNVVLSVLLALVGVALLGSFVSLVYGAEKFLTNAKTAEAG